jgi:hypothetical protein
MHIESLHDLKNALQSSEQKLQNLKKKLSNTKSKARADLTEEMLSEQKRHTLIREKILEIKQKLDESTLCGLSAAVLHSNMDRSETGRAGSEPVSPFIESLEKIQVPELQDKANSN